MDKIELPGGWTVSWLSLSEALLVIGVAVGVAFVAHLIVFALLKRVTRRSTSTVDDVVVSALRRPARWAFVAFALSLAAGSDALVGVGWDVVARFASPALLGWVAYAIVGGLERGLLAQAQVSEDPVAQRGRMTRVAILSRTAKVVIIIIALSLVMLNVPGVRDIGTTMLASAGLAALAVGAAAQPALKSLIAGLQMALTQPLRLGDLVKIDGQSGRVEEIRMSFVTVRTWDERVLVVPTNRFLEVTFENWSRVSEALTGAVMLYLMPGTDLVPIRAEFERFLGEHALWDGRNRALLMTDARPGAIEARMAMSAATIGDLFTLRCEVREHMLAWLEAFQPDALIRSPLPAQDAEPAS